MKLVVIGAGAWGTALAVSAASSNLHDVYLCARDGAQAARMQHERCNTRYLPHVAFPRNLHVLHGDAHALSSFGVADLIVIATPMSGLEPCLATIAQHKAPVTWLCKGFDLQGRLGHEIASQHAVNKAFGVLSGPSFAQEVATGQPTALVAASSDDALCDLLVQAFHSERLRVYASDDVVGVEVGGAVKNVLAIAAGLCDGLQLGMNARAALITRGLAEMTRLGVALGAKAETFMGLSGLGDLVLTATGDLSRNRQVGLLLAKGLNADQATASLGHVAEGVRCAAAVYARARSLGIEMPITSCVVALLAGNLSAQEAVALLMGREPAREA